jgi:hypothetical protein
MNAPRKFKPARLVFGLLVVSVLCAFIDLQTWPTQGVLLYVFLLLLPTVGYAFVIYWSQMFSDWSRAQRILLSVLFAPLLGLGFLFVIIGLRFTFYAD